MDTQTHPAPVVGTPRFRAPALACDAHTHVFGPLDRFPLRNPSSYPLPDASPETHRAMLSALGCERGVIVQPAPYGDDPSAMLSAIAASGGSMKGVAVAGPDIDAGTLQAWAEAGVAGLRFTEARTPAGEPFPGSVGFDALPGLAPIMRDLGLHAQLWGPAGIVIPALPDLLRHKVPLVLDHMAMLSAEAVEDDPHLSSLLELLGTGEVWIKLVLCRVERADLTGGEAVGKLHDILLRANPARMLWGSDWPYVRLAPAPDAATMLDLFARWAGDERLIHQVLVDNPTALYGF